MSRLVLYHGSAKIIETPKFGVSLRMLQQYEQRVKDINKATGMNRVALVQTLGCRMEDLLTKNTEELADD